MVDAAAVGVYRQEHVGAPPACLAAYLKDYAIVLGAVLGTRHFHLRAGCFKKPAQFESAPQIMLRFPAAFLAHIGERNGGIPAVGGIGSVRTVAVGKHAGNLGAFACLITSVAGVKIDFLPCKVAGVCHKHSRTECKGAK